MENDFLKDMDGDILSMNPKGLGKDNTQIPPSPPKPEGCKSIKTPQVPPKKIKK